MYDYGVVIGRFQPFHNCHKVLLQKALEACGHVVVVVGSCNVAPSVKNPWSGHARAFMIRANLSESEQARTSFVFARDYLYNNTLWLTAVQQQISDVIPEDASVALFGHKKDDSSFYLKMFSQWSFVDVGRLGNIDATHVRNTMFKQDLIGLRHMVPDGTYDCLVRFTTSDQWIDLKSEYDHLAEYRRQWQGAPYPPTFVTVDAVVTCSGHVLVVRRKFNPGRNLYALPGGFLDQRESIIDCAIRELREETGIKISEQDLTSMIVDNKVFDHPDRSARGRTITHAFHIDLTTRFSKLPPVKGGDDAAKAFWMPLMDVFASEEKFFEDHAHIIRHFAIKV